MLIGLLNYTSTLICRKKICIQKLIKQKCDEAKCEIFETLEIDEESYAAKESC